MKSKFLFAAIFGLVGLFVGLVAANLLSLASYGFLSRMEFHAWFGYVYYAVVYLIILAFCLAAGYLGYKIGNRQKK